VAAPQGLPHSRRRPTAPGPWSPSRGRSQISASYDDTCRGSAGVIIARGHTLSGHIRKCPCRDAGLYLLVLPVRCHGVVGPSALDEAAAYT